MGFRLSTAALCALLIVPIVLLSASTNAYISLDLSEGRCYDDGSFSLKVKNFGDSQLDLQDARIVATRIDRSDDTFEITGKFDRTILYEGSSYTTSTMFQADTGNLNESGTYEVDVTYPNCRYGVCTESIILERCPGFPYQCKLADLQITKCFERNNAFLVYFTGINDNQYENIDTLAELSVSMKSNSRTTKNVRYPAGATVKTLSSGEQIMRIPLQDGEKPYEVSFELIRCSEPPYFREISICSVPENDPNHNDLSVTERVELTPATKEKIIEIVPEGPKEPDARSGQNKVSSHVNPISKTSTTNEDVSSKLITAITIAVILLWLAASLLVSVLLIRNLKK